MTDPIEAERIVIGAAMASSGVSVADCPLHPDEFSRVPHRELWKRILTLTTASQAVDPVAVLATLEADPIPGVDGPYLHTLYAAVPVTANAGFHAATVRERSDLRRIRAAGERMAQATTIGEGDAARSLARQTLDAIDERDSGTVQRVGDLVLPTLERVERGDAPGLSTPWHDLDAKLGGLKPGTTTVIAARPGLGKSIVGLQLAAHVAARHGAALLHSLEMSGDELMRRLLSLTSQVEFGSLNGKPNDLEWKRLSSILGDLEQLPLYVDDRASVTIGDIAASARIRARDGLVLLVVDYLQLITASDRRMPREQQVAEMSRSLKLLAKDLQIAVVILAQLNRNSEARADHRPALSDLRESGSVEQDADTVLLLYRDAEDERERDQLEMAVAKNRGGPQGGVTLHWDAKHMRVTSATRRLESA